MNKEPLGGSLTIFYKTLNFPFNISPPKLNGGISDNFIVKILKKQKNNQQDSKDAQKFYKYI
jgi:hypothetical protein